MKKLILSSALILLTCHVAQCQDVAELAIIRSLLGMPQNSAVTSSSSFPVPKDSPLKVYLDVSGDTPERDKRVRESFIQWIDTLGKGEKAQKVGIELVPDAAQAQLALIYFTDFPTEVDDPRGDAPGGVDVNTRTGQPEGMPLVSNTISMTMVVFTYIIVKEPNGLKILYRRKDPLANRSTILGSAKQTNVAAAKLRKDIDKEVDKRAMKPGSEKDAKRPDNRLRFEFAKWLSTDETTLKSQ